MKKKCKNCGSEFTVKSAGHEYCSNACAVVGETIWKKKAHRKQREQYVERLRKIKLSKGCCVCGYKRSARALCFHHLRDKKTKMSGIQRGNEVFKEIEKCVILCANCHMELHDKSQKM